MSNVIHSNETWQSSQCLEKEEATVGAIVQHLVQHGYQNTHVISHTRSIWQRGSQQVVVSLVDDAWDCALDRAQDTPYLFAVDTMVVTDNWINTPTVYQVARLPDSFYGIYSYVPSNQDWIPGRDYSFGVNRLDFKRMRLLLNLYHKLGFDTGYVNFNCQINMQAAHSVLQLQQHFLDQLVYAESTELSAFHKLVTMMPVKNYSIEYDQTYVSSWLNVMIETYSSDNIIALSEKIFRCLVTPVPWIAYSGRYTVARLRSLGFDVLDDVVDHHQYDRLIEAHHKMLVFVNTASCTIANLKSQDWNKLKQRCAAAAQHNQQLLSVMRDSWDNDFAAWLSKNTL